MVLVVAGPGAKGYQTAAKKAPDQAQDQTQAPGELATTLVYLGHSCVLAVLAGHYNWVLWPATRWENAVAENLTLLQVPVARNGEAHIALNFVR